MGRITDITKSTKTLSKSDIAALEGDVGYYSRMLDDDWYEPYDAHFDISDVEEHRDALETAIDDVENGDGRTTKQAMAYANAQFKRVKAAMALYTALTGGASTAAGAGAPPKRDFDKVRAALVKVAEMWSKTYDAAIPIFDYANELLTEQGQKTVAWK